MQTLVWMKSLYELRVLTPNLTRENSLEKMAQLFGDGKHMKNESNMADLCKLTLCSMYHHCTACDRSVWGSICQDFFCLDLCHFSLCPLVCTDNDDFHLYSGQMNTPILSMSQTHDSCLRNMQITGRPCHVSLGCAFVCAFVFVFAGFYLYALYLSCIRPAVFFKVIIL